MWAARGSSWLPLLIFTVIFAGLVQCNANEIDAVAAAARNRRSIELSSAQKLITDNRLPTDIEPLSYILNLHPDFEESTFTGIVKINLTWRTEGKVIELHTHYDLQIEESNVRVRLLSGNAAYVQIKTNNLFLLCTLKFYWFSSFSFAVRSPKKSPNIWKLNERTDYQNGPFFKYI